MNEFVLYSYFRSSASYRVRIALNLKGLAYDYRSIHLLKNEQNAPDYTHLNPISQVPTLIHKGRVLTQSMAIVQYLDDIIAEPPLFPKDPFEKARVIQVCELINSGIQPMHNTGVLSELGHLGLTPEQRTAWSAHFIRKGLKAIEAFLVQTSGTYCFGHQITAADAFLQPQVFAAGRNGVQVADEFPMIARIAKGYGEIEAFKLAAPDAQPDSQEVHSR